jgi:F0F1-type ATP synthase assembly protein I
MIKSLLESDENQPEKIKPEAEKTIDAKPFEETSASIVEINEPDEPLEIVETEFDRSADLQTRESFNEKMFAELLAEMRDETTNSSDLRFKQVENAANPAADATANFELPAEIANETTTFGSSVVAQTTDMPPEKSDATLFQSSVEPESFAETARKSGLAYAAAITLFGSVVFMLIIGWFADLLLGSSPWGIVGGIVLGAAIGFIQFFRLTSQIFKNKE